MRSGYCIKGILQGDLERRGNHFILDALSQLVAAGIERILEDVHFHVSHILVIQAFQDAKHTIHIVAVVVDEIKNSFPVPSCLDQEVGSRRAQFTGFVCREESCLISLADAVFAGKACFVGNGHFRTHFWHHSILHRGYDVKGLISQSIFYVDVLVEQDINLPILAERHLTVAIPAVFADPNKHITLTGSQGCYSVIVGKFGSSRVELSVIVDAEFHLCPFSRIPFTIKNSHLNRSRSSIVADEVNFGEIASA